MNRGPRVDVQAAIPRAIDAQERRRQADPACSFLANPDHICEGVPCAVHTRAELRRAQREHDAAVERERLLSESERIRDAQEWAREQEDYMARYGPDYRMVEP